jgi:transposase
VSDLWSASGAEWVAALKLPAPYSFKVKGLCELIDAFDRQVDAYQHIIWDWLRDDRHYHAIEAIDGVGEVIGAIFVAEIGDVHRFPSPEHLCSWAGLTPRLRESDVKASARHITKQGSPLVRWAVARVRGTPKIKRDYHRIAERRGKGIARVAATRKLLTLVYYALRDGRIRCLERAGAG